MAVGDVKQSQLRKELTHTCISVLSDHFDSKTVAAMFAVQEQGHVSWSGTPTVYVQLAKLAARWSRVLLLIAL
jgi:DNA-binding NarL/FixJ family response regulator